ncbi:MAG: T9SS type A sorting domain-containing protein [Bacteroidota bacterium]
MTDKKNKRFSFSACPVFILLIISINISAQTGRLVLNNNPYVVFEPASTCYLVINNSNANAIRCMPSDNCYEDGRIVSNSETNKVKWAAQTTIDNYIIPFYYSTAMIPFRFNKTTNGTETGGGTGCFTASTWYSLDNAVWPTGTLLCGIATEDDVVDRFYVIDVLGYSANPTATMHFYYRQIPELDGSNPEADLQAQRWNSALPGVCKWEFPVGVDVPTSDYVEVTTSDFSPWAFTNEIAPLPIELLSFNGKCENNINHLAWVTASEMNNSFFTIERSIDGQTFEVIGTKQGAGNSSAILNYEFIDLSPFSNRDGSEVRYYRLKQTDFDGNYSYSKMIAVQNCDIQVITQIESIYNNGNGSIAVVISSEKGKKYNLAFYDAIGKKVINENLFVKKGKNTYLLNSQLQTGVYLVRMYAETKNFISKLFLK